MRKLVQRAACAVLLLAACGPASEPSTSARAAGTAGTTLSISVLNSQGKVANAANAAVGVQPPQGGVVTGPGGLKCGNEFRQCTADVPWGSEYLILSATKTGTSRYLVWAGDCSGDGMYCFLSGNADKQIVVVFSATAMAHPNFTAPAAHVAAYSSFLYSGLTARYVCTDCHGANLQGMGAAVSCSLCHVWPRAVPQWDSGVPASSAGAGYCGGSSNASCKTDDDCVVAGCSSEMCMAKWQASGAGSACLWLDCYDKRKYSVACGCVEDRCHWR